MIEHMLGKSLGQGSVISWVKISLVVCIAIVAMGFFTINASAQTAQSLNVTTSPDVFDLSANPGDTLTEKIRVRNNNDSPTTLQISLQKIIPNSNGDLILQNFKKTDDYATWLSLGTASVSAEPREWLDIPFTITIPKTAAFGYYWAILISNSPGKSQNGATTHISGAVALPVLLAVQKAGTIFNARLLDFKTTNSFYEYLPTQFLTTVQNLGNVHIKPAGNIFISDSLGNRIATLSFNQDAGNILPNAKRVFTTTWNDSFITYDPKMEDGNIVVDKNGKEEMQLNFHYDKLLSLRMGKYTATALIVISSDKKDLTFSQTTSFFVFPWKIMLGLLIILILTGVGFLNTIQGLWQQGKRLFAK